MSLQKELASRRAEIRKKLFPGVVVPIVRPPPLQSQHAPLKFQSVARACWRTRALQAWEEENARLAEQQQLKKDLLLNKYPMLEEGERLTCTAIAETVGVYYGYPLSAMLARKRRHSLLIAKHVCYYLCMELTIFSSVSIGKCLGGKDHATILHAYRKIERMLETNSTLRRDLEILRARIIGIREIAYWGA